MFFSPMRYGFNGMMVTQFPVGHCPGDMADNGCNEEEQTIYENTQAQLDKYGIYQTYWGTIASLLGLFILFRSVVVLVLWLQEVQKRGQVKGDTRNSDFSSLRGSMMNEPRPDMSS